MVAQVQAIYQQDSADIAARFRERAAELRQRVLLDMADSIIDNSPVDTGTYILAHRARTGPVDTGDLATRSSHGKQRGVPDAQFRNLARGNLYRSVSSAAIEASDTVFFHNIAEHADIVEWVHGYAVYAIVRNAAPVFIRRAAQQIGMGVR